jgi:hypothetical protein
LIVGRLTSEIWGALDFFRYADKTVNHWDKMERPGVVVIPFDGEALDRDLVTALPAAPAPGSPAAVEWAAAQAAAAK